MMGPAMSINSALTDDQIEEFAATFLRALCGPDENEVVNVDEKKALSFLHADA